MNFIKKFYDAEATDTGGGTETAVQDLSPAQALAKFGSKSDENTVVTPIEIPEYKEETKVEETVTAETATTDTPTETTTETPKEPTKEEIKAETPQIATQQQVIPTWQEVLKNQQPDTVLKELGFDDEKVRLIGELKDTDPKVIGIIQAYKEGKLGEYIKELGTDYQKMSAEDLMRHQLRQEYPKASEKALNALFKAEVLEKYKIDPDVYTEEEVEEGRLLLEARADKYRDSFVAAQEKLLLPTAPAPKAEVTQPVDNTAEIQRQQIEAYRKDISDNQFTRDIIANKKITLGEGDEKFSYPVDANSLIDVLTDANKWVETMYNKEVDSNGNQHFSPRIEHQLAVAAFAQDSKKFLSEYAKHLKAVGAKSVIDPIDNAKPPEGTSSAKSEKQPTTAAQAMAKAGVRTNGGF